jgi:phosphotransferase system HPr (HPr) family protein
VSGKVEATVQVHNASGLHARPAATFVRAAAAFSSEIRLINHDRGDRGGSAKSIIGVMGLGVSQGHRITIRAEGDDAEAAVAALVALVEAGIGEGIDAP